MLVLSISKNVLEALLVAC
ncbi:hypothetical protein Godav_019888 [Gossypium davidsonii]|uniref:Uncharacterized protein n=2 Tax=Gossypium TaxID=3633 RepID=A0A7J8R243_GOSDV|nr:hypothetical protein [Gossypium davidsonii]MBA0669755.1 hypothetical protein [Gossypium klotzschianum]